MSAQNDQANNEQKELIGEEKKEKTRHHSSKSKHASKEKDNFVIKIKPNNTTISPSLNKNLSDFEKICQIGKGSSGTVYKYKKKETGEYFAIKQEIANDEDQFFSEQVKVLSTLRHPTLNPLLGVIENKDEIIKRMITPFYSNGDLLHFQGKKEAKPSTWDFTQKYIILYGIAVGMSILHKNNYLHRDLKPASILITDQLEPVISSLDFLIHINSESGYYKPKAIYGTPLFTPLEAFKFDFDDENAEINGKKADVYSYSMICYFLLTGLQPFGKSKNISALFSALTNGERPQFPDDFNLSLRKLIEQCWDEDPKERPSFVKIVRTLGDPEFTQNIQNLEYKRIRKYSKRITPEEFFDEEDDDGDISYSRKRSLSLSRKSRHFSKISLVVDKDLFIIKVNRKNLTINPTLYKNISDYERIGTINNFIDKYKNKNNNQIVLIKKHNVTVEDTNLRKRIKVISNLRFPVLSPILGILNNLEGKEVNLILPFYEKGDLLHLIESKGKPPEGWDYTQKYIVLYGIAVGMTVLHKNHLFHQNLKTASIFLSNQLEPVIGNYDTPTYIHYDDGLKQELSDTYLFMAPELLDGDDNDEFEGELANVYSYAMICYQLLTGLAPFNKIKSHLSLFSAILSGERPEFPEGVNESLQKIIEQSWLQEPNQRLHFIDIVRTLSKQDFIQAIEGLDYDRIQKYIKKITPDEYIEDSNNNNSDEQEDSSKRHHSLKHRHSSKHTSREKVKLTLNEDQNNKSTKKEEEEPQPQQQQKPKTKKSEKVDDESDLIKIDFNDFNYDPSLNKDLSNFVKINIIGKGTYGCVFKYQDNKTGQFYAVKRVISDISDDLNLKREIMISSKLLHPTLQPLCGICIEDGSIALFTPYCSKGDLFHMIEEGNQNKSPPEWDETQKYIVMFGIAAGMYTLHKNNIIHRDLKPGNVLLSDNLEPLITDFGCSKMVDQSNLMYQTGTFGTMQFMAPEIYMSEELEYDGKMADVYAYAILCFQLLTGIRPFCNVRRIDMLNLISKQIRPDFPDEFNQNLKEFVQSCWNQIPEERHSFLEILDILGNKEFIEKSGNIDINRFRDYQKKVVSKKFISK